jgi:hypothetical protein
MDKVSLKDTEWLLKIYLSTKCQMELLVVNGNSLHKMPYHLCSIESSVNLNNICRHVLIGKLLIHSSQIVNVMRLHVQDTILKKLMYVVLNTIKTMKYLNGVYQKKNSVIKQPKCQIRTILTRIQTMINLK